MVGGHRKAGREVFRAVGGQAVWSPGCLRQGAGGGSNAPNRDSTGRAQR